MWFESVPGMCSEHNIPFSHWIQTETDGILSILWIIKKLKENGKCSENVRGTVSNYLVHAIPVKLQWEITLKIIMRSEYKKKMCSDHFLGTVSVRSVHRFKTLVISSHFM